jgi:hypothetical protein
MLDNLRGLAVALGAGFLMAAGNAGATPITNFTTTYATWSSPSSITGAPIDLNMNIASSGYSNSTGDVVGGFAFTGPDNGAFYLRTILYSGNLNGRNFTNNVLEGAPDAGGYINISTPAGGENAILIYLTTNGSTAITATLSDGERFTFNTTSSVMGVFGFSSSSLMTGLTLSTTPGSQVLIADLQYGTSSLPQDQPGSPTPEGATMALVGGGLLTFFGSRRKRAPRSEN